jgi:type II secretory pathway pseudopilin PulG
MLRRGADETGDTLVEIVFALVIIGVVIGAFVSTFSTGATASTAHRQLVTADGVLRSYAEEAKAAAQGCTAGAPLSLQAPPGMPGNYNVTITPASPRCPAETDTQGLTLTVRMPNGTTKSLSVEVRTP